MDNLTDEQKAELKRYREYPKDTMGHTICGHIESALSEYKACKELYPNDSPEKLKESALLFLKMELFKAEQALRFFGVE